MAKVPGKQAKGQGGTGLMSFHEQKSDSPGKGNGDSVCCGKTAWVDEVVQPTLSVRQAVSLRERVLKVLLAQSGLFLSVIAQRANGDVQKVAQQLKQLIAAGAVFKRKEQKGTYYRYYLLDGFFEPPNPVRLKIPESVEVLHRLTLLKRLRDRLISDHWYLLDAVIKDYENTLMEPDDE